MTTSFASSVNLRHRCRATSGSPHTRTAALTGWRGGRVAIASAHVQTPRDVVCRCGMAAHGPPHQPDGHQLGAVVRRAAGLGRDAGRLLRARRRALPALSPARERGAAGRGPRLGGRRELRPAAALPPPRRSRSGRPRARFRRSSPISWPPARSVEAAMGRLSARGLRQRLRVAGAHAPRDRRRDRAGPRDALADRRRRGAGRLRRPGSLRAGVAPRSPASRARRPPRSRPAACSRTRASRRSCTRGTSVPSRRASRRRRGRWPSC